MTEADKGPVVSILMATQNGARFISEQLQSIANQDYPNWTLTVSDDGSSDDTKHLVRLFAEEYPGRVRLQDGPLQGFVENFLSLISDPGTHASYFAFSDQDDIWSADHLSSALQVLETIPATVPSLYCGRTQLISEDGGLLGHSPLFARKPSFRNAVVQSLAGANTMVFNAATRHLLAITSKPTPVSHDWWAYQIVTAVGGIVHYDERPTVRYRQHDSNVVGTNMGWRAKIKRLRMLKSKSFATWLQINTGALIAHECLLTSSSREILSHVTVMCSGSFSLRVKSYLRAKLYRQSIVGTIALIVAVALGLLKFVEKRRRNGMMF